MNQLENEADRLYEVMSHLDTSLQRIGEFWNDRVATAISVNQVNDLINSCNKANSEIRSLTVEVGWKMNELEMLTKESE